TTPLTSSLPHLSHWKVNRSRISVSRSMPSRLISTLQSGQRIKDLTDEDSEVPLGGIGQPVTTWSRPIVSVPLESYAVYKFRHTAGSPNDKRHQHYGWKQDRNPQPHRN